MMQIIAFGILLYCGMEHFDVVIGAVDFVLGIVMPFLVGGAIAFVINVPMKSIERHLFAKNGKLAKWRRPVAYLLTLALVIGIITLALVVVIPELGNTDFHDCTAGSGCGKSRTEVADRSSGQLSGTCPCGGGA